MPQRVTERGDPNKENRLRTAQSVYASYSELEGMEAITRYLDSTPGGDTYINAPYVDDAAEIVWGQNIVNPVGEAIDDIISYPGEVKNELERGWYELNNPYNWIDLSGGGYY